MMKEINILNWNDYLDDGGKLSYHQWIQCLIDSGNITKSLGCRAITTFNDGFSIMSLPDQIKGDKHKSKALNRLNSF